MSERMPRALSGGQQQRVALARALVTEPTILLLDEPLSALDANLREEMQREIKRIQRLVGITAVYVTHDQAEAMGMSDHIAVLYRGKVEQVGTPEDIYYRPATKFVASFIGKATLFPIEYAANGTIKLQGANRTVLQGQFQEVNEGDSRFLVVRAEQMRVTSAPDGNDMHYSGRIVDVRFTGGTHLYQVETDNQILCSVMAEPGATPQPLNTAVQLRIGR